jgi:hypothetical protein
MKKMGRPSSWTEEDLQTLRDLVPHKLIQDISKILDKPQGTVRWYCRKLGLKYKTIRPNWKPEEIEIVRRMAPNHLASEIAEVLGRCEYGVILKSQRLGIKVTKGPDPRHWTPLEDRKLHFLCSVMSTKAAAKKLGRSPRGVHDRVKKLGLKWHRGKRSIKSVAEDLGIHQQTLHRLANKLGVRLYVPPGSNHGNVSDEVYEQLLTWWFEEAPDLRKAA